MSRSLGHDRPAARHLLVVVGYTALFTWLFGESILTHRYLAESDLYEYYLPIFLAPITRWSSYEFSGLPAFADPGDFSVYPPHFVFARLLHAWNGFIVSAFVMAATFTYAYVYRITRSRTAAVFAGLAYGMSEAMLDRIPHLGTLHCFAWLPLIVLSIEGLRAAEHTRGWLAAGGIGVACAFLSGHPQPAVYTVYVTIAYALACGVATRASARYYAAIAGMYFIAGLLASVKAIPLVEASQLMARQVVNFGQFAGHANTAAQMLSALFPTILHEGREAPTYVGLATLAFAIAGASYFRDGWRVAFWVCAAVFALLVGAGPATPLPQLLYSVVPFYQKFRVGARQLFLAAFGAAFLAGYAIDRLERGDLPIRRLRTTTAVLAAVIVAGAAVQALMPAAFEYEVRRVPALQLPILPTSIWIQLVIAAGTCALIWTIRPGRRFVFGMIAVAALLVGDNLYSFPYPVTMIGLNFGALPAAATQPSAHAITIRDRLQPLSQRALALGGTQIDAIVPAAFARLWRTPIAGGYGPMLLERYAELATMGTNGSIRPGTLAPYDSALDLMAVKYLFVSEDDQQPPDTFDADGFTWAVPELSLPVGPADCHLPYTRSVSLPLPSGIQLTRIGLVTHLRCSEHIPQNSVVALLRVVEADGAIQEFAVRTGVETADPGVINPDIAARAQHTPPAHRFHDPGTSALRALATFTLPAPITGGHLELETPPTGGWLSLDRVSLGDVHGASRPVSAPAVWLGDEARWRPVDHFATSRISDRPRDEAADNETQYTIYENTRAQPRAWITTAVRAVTDRDAADIVHRGQFADGSRFDGARIALVSADEGPPPGPFGDGPATATVQRIEDSHITAQATTTGGGFLVLSETAYPGWRASIDGQPASLRRANLSMQGVVIPPGAHTVEFDFASATERAGIAMSIGGILICAVLLISEWRARWRSLADAA